MPSHTQMGGDTHYYGIYEPILGIAIVSDCLFLCELRPLMVCLLEGVPFKHLGKIHVRVLFWEALDAFMFVAAWCGVTRAVVSSS